MTVSFLPERLDVAAFARAQAKLHGEIPPSRLPRLLQECAPGVPAEAPVQWTAMGEQRTATGGPSQAWMHLEVSARVPLTCQRCLQPVVLPLSVDRWFRFVVDEKTAMAEDDAADEDLLVISRRFDLPELIEDELLMAVPLVPLHEACPTALPVPEADEPAQAARGHAEAPEKPHPFAVLAQLKR